MNGRAALTYTYTYTKSFIRDINGKTTEYAYDLNGNLSQVAEAGKVLVTYEYDAVSRISKIRFANGVTTSYDYDTERNAASIRTTGKDGSTLLDYSCRYDRNGNRVEKRVERPAGHSAEHSSEEDYAEAYTERYTYDAFGTIVTSTEALQNRYTYNGEAFDKTTEQYYLRKRFYNPKLSRYL